MLTSKTTRNQCNSLHWQPNTNLPVKQSSIYKSTNQIYSKHPFINHFHIHLTSCQNRVFMWCKPIHFDQFHWFMKETWLAVTWAIIKTCFYVIIMTVVIICHLCLLLFGLMPTYIIVTSQCFSIHLKNNNCWPK